MTKLYDKPDADICRVWACPTGWATATLTGFYPWMFNSGDEPFAGESHSHSSFRTQEALPPGPWRPCFLVGDEPCESLSTKESYAVIVAAMKVRRMRRRQDGEGVYDALQELDKAVDVYLASSGRIDKPSPRLTPEEQEVLDAAKVFYDEYADCKSATTPTCQRLINVVGDLRASEQPKVCDHCGQELPK